MRHIQLNQRTAVKFFPQQRIIVLVQADALGSGATESVALDAKDMNNLHDLIEELRD